MAFGATIRLPTPCTAHQSSSSPDHSFPLMCTLGAIQWWLLSFWLCRLLGSGPVQGSFLFLSLSLFFCINQQEEDNPCIVIEIQSCVAPKFFSYSYHTGLRLYLILCPPILRRRFVIISHSL